MARKKLGRGPRSYKTRPLEIREKKPRILIACEGGKTEPNYFRAFRPANVVVHGLGMNTFSFWNRNRFLVVSYPPGNLALSFHHQR
jgi:hypothetical protein